MRATIGAATGAAEDGVGCARRGLHHAARGELVAASEWFGRAVALLPGDSATWCNLGNTLRLLGRLDEAADALARAVALRPDCPDSAGNLGLVLGQQGRHDEAIAAHRRAVALDPTRAAGRHHLGVALTEAGRHAEALAEFDAALARAPGLVEARNFRGVALHRLGRHAEAIAALDGVLARAPEHHEAHNNRGIALRDLGDHEAALASFRRALALRPDFAPAWSNLGIVQDQAGDPAAALGSFGRALALQPDLVEARHNRAMTRLSLGDWPDAWHEYECRLCLPGRVGRSTGRPRWDGGPLAGRTVLLHAEQGLGDTLLFVRFAAEVRDRGGRVVVECQPPLVDLLALCPLIDEVVGAGTVLPDHDLQAPLMSLPAILGTTLADLPGPAPYLVADPGAVAQWGRRLGPRRGPRVGIAWQGSPRYAADRHRSIPLGEFAALDAVPGVELVSLQWGFGVEQLAAWPGRPIVLPEHLDPAWTGNFAEMAALVRNLDVVVTPDTAAAHLAGGLGVPAWVALGAAPDWRWLRGRRDSPWYPAARLFRQDRRGDWAGVLGAIAVALAGLRAG